MLTVGLHCDITKPPLLIGRYFGCLVFVTVFGYARRISSDKICIFLKGVGFFVFGSRVFAFCISESLQIWSEIII